MCLYEACTDRPVGWSHLQTTLVSIDSRSSRIQGRGYPHREAAVVFYACVRNNVISMPGSVTLCLPRPQPGIQVPMNDKEVLTKIDKAHHMTDEICLGADPNRLWIRSRAGRVISPVCMSGGMMFIRISSSIQP
jgi:hypothetical protein